MGRAGRELALPFRAKEERRLQGPGVMALNGENAGGTDSPLMRLR
jgi:hypothetical protein